MVIKRVRRTMVALAYTVALLAIIATLIPTVPLVEVAVQAEFTKQVSISGGSPAPQLSAALTSAGYSGGSTLDELTVCVPSTNANTLYLGSGSSVNASSGFPLPPGTCITYRAGTRAIDVTRIFCFEATTESIAITLRER